MSFINLENGFVLRDKAEIGKGRIHSIIGAGADGSIVEQSKVHDQIIQRRFFSDKHIEVSCYRVENNKARLVGTKNIYFGEGGHNVL